ncbi:hypothetical protein CL620_01320, partial [archaeon]|nr:hypothetical protein [archaeon]
QDDFNLASWQLGQRLTDEETQKHHHSMVFKGLQDEDDFIEQVIDWETSTDSNFKKNNYRPSNIIEQGTWGRRMQIFFDEFYGEAIEIQPGQTFTRNADARPFAGIVWSGVGSINENKLDATYTEQKEFLVTPERQVTIHNTGALPLLIYTVFPIQEQ